ncbi:MAG: hypothetical protein JW834_00545 [Candidatus Diapherotrites archaeon]|nr:hypothetical protein [Candidatus Diapherotrites archaeon]
MKCTFCGRDIQVGTGKIVADRDGTIIPLCSRKCEANLLKLKRKPQRVKWTLRYRQEKATRLHGKEEKIVKIEEKKTRTRTPKKERRVARKEKKEAKKAEKKRKTQKGAEPKKEEAPQ